MKKSILQDFKMEEDTFFEKLKENVELTRKKILRCMVKTKTQSESKISWNSIWTELQKTDLQVSTEMMQRLKVWYLLREAFSAPQSPKEKLDIKKDDYVTEANRDLSLTLPAFMIESLIEPEDCHLNPLTEITSNKSLSSQQSKKPKSNVQHHAWRDQVTIQKSDVLPLYDSKIDGRRSGQSMSVSCPHFGNDIPTPTYISSNYQSSCSTSHFQSNQGHEFQSIHCPGKINNSCPTVNLLKADSPCFYPRSHAISNHHEWISGVETNNFSNQRNYGMKFNVPNGYSANKFKFRPDELENRNPNYQGAHCRAPFRKYQLRRMYIENNNPRRRRSRRSSSYKKNSCPWNRESQKVEQQFYPQLRETRWNAPKKGSCKARANHQRQKSKHYNSLKDNHIKYNESIFPPKDYDCEKGDLLVHAIMSLSIKPKDVELALEDRGYELKYITTRKCKFPNKWVCSLIANGDKTHILTTKSIFINSREVEFVFDEKEITPYLLN